MVSSSQSSVSVETWLVLVKLGAVVVDSTAVVKVSSVDVSEPVDASEAADVSGS